MNCKQILPYLPGHAGGDLRADTIAFVDEHLATCKSCRAESERARRVVGGLALLAHRDLEPPAFLLDAILEQTSEAVPERSRMIPMLPVAAGDLSRLVTEHKDTIASVGATAIVAAGAAYALWRAVKGSRAAQPAT
jgi:predicted anti-sigma-YlaC factor YlaD